MVEYLWFKVDDIGVDFFSVWKLGNMSFVLNFDFECF